MLLMFIRKYGSWDAHSVLKKRINPLILRHLQHASAVGAGFIPVLLTAVKIQNRYHAAARTGINPAPTVDACNTLDINALAK